MVYCVFINGKGKGRLKNLFNNHITNFPKLYPTMAEMLTEKPYNLTWDTRVKIHFTKRIDTPRWKGYRTPFKTWHCGTITELKKKVRKYYETHVWKNNGKKKESEVKEVVVKK